MAKLLEVTGLKAYYGPTQALFDVSFSLDQGGVITLLGANGAGKSTTLRAICGMVRADGSIRLDGKSIGGKATEDIVRLGVGHVPEGRGTFARLSVDENLRVAGHVRKDKAAAQRDRDMVLEYFPDSQSAPVSAGRHAVGRRAADAGDQPRPDAGASPDAAGRAVVRSRPADRAGDLPHHASDQCGVPA